MGKFWLFFKGLVAFLIVFFGAEILLSANTPSSITYGVAATGIVYFLQAMQMLIVLENLDQSMIDNAVTIYDVSDDSGHSLFASFDINEADSMVEAIARTDIELNNIYTGHITLDWNQDNKKSLQMFKDLIEKEKESD